MRFDLGSPVDCAGEPYGELADIVIDPAARRLTHLVVQPHNRHDLARLVPVQQVRESTALHGGISLACSIEEVSQLDSVQRSVFVRLGEQPVEDPDSDVGIVETYELPPYGPMGVDALGSGMPPIDIDPHATLSYDRVPKDTAELRHSSSVTSAEGDHLGRLDGLVVDDQQQIVYLVLERGHLWGKREIAIPIDVVARIESDEVQLSLSKDQVSELKPLEGHSG